MTFLGIGIFSIMDALMKRAAIVAGVYPVLLTRSLIGAAVLLPLWLWRGGRWPEREVLRLHLLRGAMVAGMATTFFWGLVRMPLAEGIALSFISPLIALGLAAVRLGERIRPRAIGAALMGLAGVAVIAAGKAAGQDGAGQDEAGRDFLGMGAILLSAVFYAANLVLQREQAQRAAPLEVAAFQTTVLAMILLPAAPFLWRTLDPAPLADAAAAALLASVSLMLLAWAYARAEAQVLVPVEYTAFLWAALMGWLWFAEPVTAPTLAGLVLIVAGVWFGTRGTAEPATPPG